MLKLVGLAAGIFSILCRFKNCEDGILWIFTRVYDPMCRRNRESFWDELGGIRGLWSDPWCIGGDFNMIRFSGERIRGGGLSPAMRRFLEVIEDLEQRDTLCRGTLSLGVAG